MKKLGLINFFNEEIIHELIESKEDIEKIELELENKFDCKINDGDKIIIMNYRMF